MDESWEEEATQQATQPLPPHNGISPSDSSGQDYSGVICFLHPCSPAAIAIVHRTQKSNSNLVVRLPVPEAGTKGRRAPQDDPEADDEEDPESTQIDDHGQCTAIDLALRYKPGPKDPVSGFLFGRNPYKCDIVMIDNPSRRRISNMHFRIYVNAGGALMLEDMSTNGTWVDNYCLIKNGRHGQKRVLSPGSIIFMCPGTPEELVRFIVRIPKDSGKGLKSAVSTPEKPQQPPPSSHLLSSPGPPPKFGPLRIDAASPGVVIQSPQQRNAAALLRIPPIAQRMPGDQHRRPIVDVDQASNVTRDAHTMREPSGSMIWSGDAKYLLSVQIGKGAFATVNKAYERTTGDVVAVKMIAKRTFAAQIGKENQGVKKEVDILERLQHPNIVQYITCFEDNTHVYLVMEYIEHGDLNGYLNEHKTMPENLTKQVVTQVLHGLEYIHKMSISHRDLKPDNVLIACNDPMIVKLSDFGLAKMVNNEETFLKTFCGTMLYLAPEVFPGYMSVIMADAQGLDGNHKRKRLPGDDAGGADSPATRGKTKRERIPYNQAVDMWSLGCVIYCLLTGNPPFEGKNQDQMCKLVTRGQFDEAKLRGFVGLDNDACVDFIKRLLQVRPEMRMMENEALRHEWLYTESVEESVSMEYDEDEVLGVEYSGSQQLRSSHQAMEEEDDAETNVADSDTDTEDSESEDDEGLPTPRADRNVNVELQDSMARVTFSQMDPFDIQTSENSTSSGNECYESLINSRQEFSQGSTGISVIDRARADARNPGVSLQGSSGVFPDGGFEISGSEDSDSLPAAQRLGDAFEYEKKRRQSREHNRQNQYTSAESKLDRLAFVTASPEVFCTPPSVQPRNSQPSVMSPFSFANQGHFNFSPESLRNPSPREQPAFQSPRGKPAFNPPRTVMVPQPEDDDLPSTQSVFSQPDEASGFRVPPLPWGRLIPLPNSITTDPIMLIEQLVSFGRACNCTFKPDDIRISKFHIAIQIHYPERERQTDPRDSRVGEWRATDNMVVSFQVMGRSGVYVNGKRYTQHYVGRLWDGDELIFFRDYTQEKQEMFGYKVELNIGHVRRDDASSIYYPGYFNTVNHHNHERGNDTTPFSRANTEIPGDMTMRIRA
ncbi:Pkinase-domain-containing protein [Wilcoxina mikolae CBS 423.85]|nr:Pkinase-domain-containing protein [Wilcoxina mikolae CBS 423.85]